MSAWNLQRRRGPSEFLQKTRKERPRKEKGFGLPLRRWRLDKVCFCRRLRTLAFPRLLGCTIPRKEQRRPRESALLDFTVPLDPQAQNKNPVLQALIGEAEGEKEAHSAKLDLLFLPRLNIALPRVCREAEGATSEEDCDACPSGRQGSQSVSP